MPAPPSVPFATRRTAAWCALALALTAACGNDDRASAEDLRHEACTTFLSALEIEQQDGPQADAEALYDAAAVKAQSAAKADEKYEEFAAALDGAGFRHLRQQGDQVLLFRTCSPEARSKESEEAP